MLAHRDQVRTCFALCILPKLVYYLLGCGLFMKGIHFGRLKERYDQSVIKDVCVKWQQSEFGLRKKKKEEFASLAVHSQTT